MNKMGKEAMPGATLGGSWRQCRPNCKANSTIQLVQNSQVAMNEPRTRLLQLFKDRAVSFGRFTLASGKESTYYINSKKAIFHAETIDLLADVLFEMTRDLNIDAAGGL